MEQGSPKMEVRTAKITFNKSGGNSSANAVTNRLTLPTRWVKELGVTKEDREVSLVYDPENRRIVVQFH